MFGYETDAWFPPRPYVAPGQPIGVVRQSGDTREFALVRWGFIPAWARQAPKGKPLINARSETVVEKPTFRASIRRRRCLIPADGFYEWQGSVPGRKQAFHVTRPNGAVFAFAGLWDHWLASDGSEIETAAILTTSANAKLMPIHHRMPVIVCADHYQAWLTQDERDLQLIRTILRPAPNDFFTPTPVEMERRRPSPTGTPAARQGDQLDLF